MHDCPALKKERWVNPEGHIPHTETTDRNGKSMQCISLEGMNIVITESTSIQEHGMSLV